MNRRWKGTGHNSVVRDEAGQDWIFYHAIDPNDLYNPGTEAAKRPMLIDPLVYHDGWPEIEESSPSTTRDGRGPWYANGESSQAPVKAEPSFIR